MPGKPTGSQIEMERRHILEGEARIARQEALIRKLDLAGNLDLILIARELLEALRESVSLSRERLSSLERHREDWLMGRPKVHYPPSKICATYDRPRPPRRPGAGPVRY